MPMQPNVNGNRLDGRRRRTTMRFRYVIGAIAISAVAACSSTPQISSPPDTGPTFPASPAPLTVFTHCGFWEIEYDGRLWTPDSIGRGDMPAGTDSMATTGSVILASHDQLRFTADSGLIVEFAPAPPDLDPIPGCD